MARLYVSLFLLFGIGIGLCEHVRGDDRANLDKSKQGSSSQSRTDLHGDPLPGGAIARLGVARLMHAGTALSVAYSPDGKILASAGDDRMIRLWDPENGKELRVLKDHGDSVCCVAFSPDGKSLASGSADQTIRCWDVATGKALSRHTLPTKVETVAYSPDGKMLASGWGKHIILWEVETGKTIRHWPAHRGGVLSVAFSPDGKVLASGGHPGNKDDKDDYDLAAWDPATGTRLFDRNDHWIKLSQLKFSPDGNTLAATGFGGTHCIGLYQTSTGRRMRLIDNTSGDCIAFAPDGKSVAVADRFTLDFWSVPDGKLLGQVRADERALAFSPDGKTLASAGMNGRVGLWDVAQREPKEVFPGHTDRIVGIAVSPDSKTAITGSWDGTARQWDLASGKQIRRFQETEIVQPSIRHMVSSIALAPDGKTLAIAGFRTDGEITLWEANGGKKLGKIKGHLGPIRSMGFSPDGKTLLSDGISDENLHLWEAATGRELRTFNKGREDSNGMAFSQDGRYAAALADGLRIWETPTGKLLHHVQTGAEGVAFSPDGVLMAIGRPTERNVITFLEVATGELAGSYELDGDLGRSPPMGFSPDGQFLAAITGDKIHLLEVGTGRKVQSFAGHLGNLTCMAFSPDGKMLITGGEDGTALVWDLAGLTEEKDKGVLEPEMVGALWDDLKSGDHLKAYDALRRLENSPAPTLTFLQRQLRPAASADRKRLTQLIADLDSDDFESREKASRELAELQEIAEKALRQALESKPSLEMTRRIEELLAKQQSPHEGRRIRWAMMLLERHDNSQSRRLLESLAKGEPECRLTQEAKAALERLRGKGP